MKIDPKEMTSLASICVVLTSFLLFSSCSYNLGFLEPGPAPRKESVTGNSYGAYLSGRVAHLRKDFNSAADFYIQALNQDPNNQELTGRVYVILASQGRISEAAEYAEKALAQGDKNNFTYIIIAVDKMKKGQYVEAEEIINKLHGPVYKDFIVPLMSAWTYVGENNKEKALKTLKIIAKEPSFKSLYYFNLAMIYDYFDDTEKADKIYAEIIKDQDIDISFRLLQIMTNYYVRQNRKAEALGLLNRFNEEKAFADMVSGLKAKVKNANPSTTPKIINNPNIGLSEALFSIAATLRQGVEGVDLSHVFVCLSIYANPQYDLAQLLLADILETRDMQTEAISVYDNIPKTSVAYYTAQIKKAANYSYVQNYKAAELLLKSIALDHPTTQVYMDLGDNLRLQNKNDEAIGYYKKAIKSVPTITNNYWILFYSLGVSYELNGDWEKAEQNFRTAVELSQNHYLVLNYLGYCWLKQGKNVNEAFTMIADAYNQAPLDGNIADSMGWAFYKLGLYDEAILYLERASELEPASAVIYDHLGDAYWQNGRHTEALYQWKHALSMKVDENSEVDIDQIKKKIKRGMKPVKPLEFDRKVIDTAIKSLAQ